MAETMTEVPPNAAETSFGYRNVPEEERQTLVNRVFATVAERYDLMNDLMSGGLHRLWKDDFIAALNPPPRGDRPYRLLDVAGGTGDVAIRYARASGPNATAVLCDISPEMIEVGQRRVRDAGLDERITFAQGNAEALAFPDRAFDAYTIAFGIRNVTHIDKALSQAFRVLKTGGRFCAWSSRASRCRSSTGSTTSTPSMSSRGLAPSQPGTPSPTAIWWRASASSRARAASPRMIRAAGFERVSYRNLTGGIAAIHSGWKL